MEYTNLEKKLQKIITILDDSNYLQFLDASDCEFDMDSAIEDRYYDLIEDSTIHMNFTVKRSFGLLEIKNDIIDTKQLQVYCYLKITENELVCFKKIVNTDYQDRDKTLDNLAIEFNKIEALVEKICKEVGLTRIYE